jgi:hypothetical protein
MLPSYLKAVYDELRRGEERLSEIENGEVLNLKEIRKMLSNKAVLKERREAEYRKILEKIRRNAVNVEVAKSIAIAKTLPLKKTPKIVVKQNNVEKPLVSELPLIALHGGDVHKLMSWRVLRGMIENAER